jgi:hypothetical protein
VKEVEEACRCEKHQLKAGDILKVVKAIESGVCPVYLDTMCATAQDAVIARHHRVLAKIYQALDTCM